VILLTKELKALKVWAKMEKMTNVFGYSPHPVIKMAKILHTNTMAFFFIFQRSVQCHMYTVQWVDFCTKKL